MRFKDMFLRVLHSEFTLGESDRVIATAYKTSAYKCESSSSDAPDASSAVILKLHGISAPHGSAPSSLNLWRHSML